MYRKKTYKELSDHDPVKYISKLWQVEKMEYRMNNILFGGLVIRNINYADKNEPYIKGGRGRFEMFNQHMCLVYGYQTNTTLLEEHSIVSLDFTLDRKNEDLQKKASTDDLVIGFNCSELYNKFADAFRHLYMKEPVIITNSPTNGYILRFTLESRNGITSFAKCTDSKMIFPTQSIEKFQTMDNHMYFNKTYAIKDIFRHLNKDIKNLFNNKVCKVFSFVTDLYPDPINTTNNLSGVRVYLSYQLEDISSIPSFDYQLSCNDLVIVFEDGMPYLNKMQHIFGNYNFCDIEFLNTKKNYSALSFTLTKESVTENKIVPNNIVGEPRPIIALDFTKVRTYRGIATVTDIFEVEYYNLSDLAANSNNPIPGVFYFDVDPNLQSEEFVESIGVYHATTEVTINARNGKSCDPNVKEYMDEIRKYGDEGELDNKTIFYTKHLKDKDELPEKFSISVENTPLAIEYGVKFTGTMRYEKEQKKEMNELSCSYGRLYFIAVGRTPDFDIYVPGGYGPYCIKGYDFEPLRVYEMVSISKYPHGDYEFEFQKKYIIDRYEYIKSAKCTDLIDLNVPIIVVNRSLANTLTETCAKHINYNYTETSQYHFDSKIIEIENTVTDCIKMKIRIKDVSKKYPPEYELDYQNYKKDSLAYLAAEFNKKRGNNMGSVKVRKGLKVSFNEDYTKFLEELKDISEATKQFITFDHVNFPSYFDVEDIRFSGIATIVFWKDGTKTVVKMHKDEKKFDVEKAIMAAFMKRALESKGGTVKNRSMDSVLGKYVAKYEKEQEEAKKSKKSKKSEE